MALPPLASVPDLAAYVGEEIPEDDQRAGAVLRMASSVVRAYVGKTFEGGTVPDGAADVTLDMAARVWFNPAGLVQDGVDDTTRRWAESKVSEGFYLTAANKMILDSLRDRPQGGLYTLGVTRGDQSVNGTVYVPTGPPPSGYPFPWYDSDDPLIR